MKTFLHVLLSSLFITISFLLGVAIMMFGWGLQPMSWAWLIGGAVAQMAAGSIFGLAIAFNSTNE